MNTSKPKGFLRFDWPYHFVTLPLTLFLVVYSGIYCFRAIRDDGHLTTPVLFFVTSLCLVFAATRIRVYATKTQDRIVRAEEQFRYFRLTGSTLPAELNLAQIIALRYAGDDELPELSRRAADEGMKPEDIRSAVRNWREDSMRI